MPRVPSTRWRVIDVLSTVRELAKTVDQKKVLSEQGRYFYKAALSEIVALLNASQDPSYFAGPATLTLTGSTPNVIQTTTIATAINHDRIVALSHSQVGQVVYRTPDEFMSLLRQNFSHASYAGDVVWTQMANDILIRIGSSVPATVATIDMWYQRQPNYPVTESDWQNAYVDLADRWVPLLIKRIHTLMIMQKDADIPTNLYQEQVADFERIAVYAQNEYLNRFKTGDK